MSVTIITGGPGLGHTNKRDSSDETRNVSGRQTGLPVPRGKLLPPFSSSILKMEATGNSVSVVTVFQNTLCHISEDCNPK